ncbi:MAG: hypothetical protein ACJ0BK_01485 [Coraliomargaritaceae bacterium]
MKYSLFLLLLVSTLSATTTIDLGFQDPCFPVGFETNTIPIEGGTVEVVPLGVGVPVLHGTGMTNVFVITATPNAGYVFSHWLKGFEIIEGGGPIIEITYTTATHTDDFLICPLVVILPTVFSAVFNTAPQAPVLDLETFYECNSGESITVDATPSDGYPADYTYQWYFKGVNTSSYLLIQSAFNGTSSSYLIDGNPVSDGTWKVEVTNESGTTAAEFNYRVYADLDSDGLSDGQEEFVLGTDPSLTDTDGDGLGDGTEVNTYASNPLAADTTGDGFTDGFLVSEGFIPTSDYNALRTETVNQIKDARVGSTMIEVSGGKADITMTLEETSDLSDWSSATTSEMTIEVDAPAGTRFYRFKMAE